MQTLFSKKMRSRAGESLVETMVAILIIAIAALVLMSFANSSSNISGKTRDRFDTYMSEKNELENRKTMGAADVLIKYKSNTSTEPVLVGGTSSGSLRNYWKEGS